MTQTTSLLAYILSLFITGLKGQDPCNIMQDANVYVLPMQSRALQCEVCNVSSAGATSEWFYKSQSSPEIKLMTEPNKYSISNDQLIIMNTVTSDRGRYRCVLTPVGGDPVNGSFAFSYTVLRIPQFRSPRKSVNVTEGDNFTLVYDIFYEEGNAPQLKVGEFEVRKGPSTILTTCYNDSTCSPPNNARISASANFNNMAIDVTVTFKGAMLTDANIYPATARASFSDTTEAYSATITVVVLNSTAVAASTPTLTTSDMPMTATSSVLMGTPSITSTAPSTSPTNVASSACTTALIGIGVGIPVTFMLTAIISSLLTLLITYLCLTRGKCLKSASPVPVYDPLSSDTSVEMKSNVYGQKTT